MERTKDKLLRLPISPQSVHTFLSSSDCNKLGIIEKNRSLELATMYGLAGVLIGILVSILSGLNLDGNALITFSGHQTFTYLLGSILIFSIPMAAVAAYLGKRAVYHEVVFGPKLDNVKKDFFLLCVEAEEHEVDSVDWVLKDSRAIRSSEIDLKEQIELGLRKS